MESVFKEILKNPNRTQKKSQKTQSIWIRKILFPALAAFLVGINRISAGFGCLDPVRKLKLADFGPSFNKYKNKAFSGPTSTKIKLLQINEILGERSPRDEKLFFPQNSEILSTLEKPLRPSRTALNSTWGSV